jgi:hypothetical protein
MPDRQAASGVVNGVEAAPPETITTARWGTADITEP